MKAFIENSVLLFLSRIWLLDALKRIEKTIPTRLLYKEIKKPGLKLSLRFAFIGLRPTEFFSLSHTRDEKKKNFRFSLFVNKKSKMSVGQGTEKIPLKHIHDDDWLQTQYISLVACYILPSNC